MIDGMTRRGVMNRAVEACAATLMVQQEPTAEGDQDKLEDASSIDRQCVIGAGLTEAEADCWEAIAKAAGLYLALPDSHPMEKQEIASAIHVIQYRLLARATYRKYIELHKTAEKKTP